MFYERSFFLTCDKKGGGAKDILFCVPTSWFSFLSFGSQILCSSQMEFSLASKDCLSRLVIVVGIDLLLSFSQAIFEL